MTLPIRHIVKLFFLLFLVSCNQNKTSGRQKSKALTIVLQPFNDIEEARVEYVFEMLKNVYPNVLLNAKIELPKQAYYKPRNRYKADSILFFFNKKVADNEVIIGLTSKDISTRKKLIEDFGIMGLAYCPGKVCVASSFRLDSKNKNEQLFKVAIHELGHTQGLPHCKQKDCFMRDAEGKNPINEEKDFCNKCKSHLINKGFQI